MLRLLHGLLVVVSGQVKPRENSVKAGDRALPASAISESSSDRDHQLLLLALRRHDDEGTPLVPIVAQPVLWQVSPLGGLKVLPREGKPVTSWSNPAEAWLDVVAERLQRRPYRDPLRAGIVIHWEG